MKNIKQILKKIPIELLEEVYLDRQNDKIASDEQLSDSIILNLKNYKALVIPDLQIPAEHKDALDFCIAVNKKYKCNLIMNVGDEIDNHMLSYHEKDPNAFSASQEFKLSKIKLKEWYKAFPKMNICHSNHGSLMYRKAKTMGMSKEHLKTLKELYGLGNGWTWANKFIIKQKNNPDIMFIHNFSSSTLNNIKSQGICVVQGHYHSKAELVIQMLESGIQLIGATVGSLVNKFHPFLSYARNHKEIARLGVWIVENGKFTYIPMIVDKNNRWIGKL